jgi:class 3 adenylate cyclase
MSEQSRQLAAIMFTDIVGYTALMGEDEQKAFQLLKKNRKVQRPIIEKYNGRWLKEMGDGVLASFTTVVMLYIVLPPFRKPVKIIPTLI